MAYLTHDALAALGLKQFGNDVLISDKASIYNAESISIGTNVRVDDFCVLSGRIDFGSNIHIAVFCTIAGGSEGVTFEDFSGLAYGCHVFAQSDDYSGRTMAGPIFPERFKNVTKKPILVKKHGIVGTGSIVLPGVTLEEGTAVGAMSLVTKSTRPWGIYSGIPAKRIKERHRDILEFEQRYLAEVGRGSTGRG